MLYLLLEDILPKCVSGIIIGYCDDDVILLCQDEYPYLISDIPITNLQLINEKNWRYIKYLHLDEDISLDDYNLLTGLEKLVACTNIIPVGELFQHQDNLMYYSSYGLCPVIVYIDKFKNNNIVLVYKLTNNLIPYDTTNHREEQDLIAYFRPFEIYYGAEKYSPHFGILIELGKNKYAYISNTIYVFETDEAIIEYHYYIRPFSGENPIALSENFVYDLLYKKYTTRKDTVYDFYNFWKETDTQDIKILKRIY
jgi:hypothetical protein